MLDIFMFAQDRIETLTYSITILQCIYFVPFMLLGGEVWRREQEEKLLPWLLSIAMAALFVALFLVGAALVFSFTWLPFITIGRLG